MKKAGEECDPKGAADKKLGCVKDYRCATGKAKDDKNKAKIEAMFKTTTKHQCVKAADCGTTKKHSDDAKVEYTIECSATKVLAGMVSAFAIAYTI